MATKDTEETKTLTREEKLDKVHNVKVVYARANGGNDEITFDAYVDGKKVPVVTVNNGKMEAHFTFPKATAAEDEGSSDDE